MKTQIVLLIIVAIFTTGLTNANAQLPDFVPTNGLLGYYPFSGNANDESTNGNNGTNNGSTLTEDRFGASNSAYNFNGTSNYISVPNIAVQGANSRTISFWIKTNSTNEVSMVISTGTDAEVNGGNFNLRLENSNEYIGFMGGNYTAGGYDYYPTGNVVLNDNEWHNILVTYNGTTVNFYIDGIFEKSTNKTLFTDGQANYIGKSNSLNLVSANWFAGSVDDVGFWNRALNEEEIQQLYLSQIDGCIDPIACNYNQQAIEDDGSCFYAQEFYDCAGNCLADFDGDGICDELELPGCTYAFACNYNPQATQDDGSCTIAECNYDCEGNCLLDLNNNGICDLAELPGCTSIDALNYNPDATLDDGSCIITCKGDFNNDGQITVDDLLAFLASFGNYCIGAGCMDPAGCNFDPEATFDLGYCEYPLEYFNCDGLPVNDADGDGVPDELEVPGCTDPSAANYNSFATDDDGSCLYGVQGDEHSCGAAEVHNPELLYGTVTDIDGNTYRTIIIGNQEWMAENLNTSRYANGDVIPNITDNAQWAVQSQGAWCYYENDIQYACPYGKLYNWYVTVDERNVCPTGWHVPSDAEWTVLTTYLGAVEVVGGKMKSTGTEHWLSPNDGATNESGFSGLPGGYRNGTNVYFNYVGYFGFWWSSTDHNDYAAWGRDLRSHNSGVSLYNGGKVDGFSVRCLMD
jgi:uncharacterized protein (TIGR02145 family)